MKKKFYSLILFFVIILLLFSPKVFGADTDKIAFEGNVETGAWDTITQLPEYTDYNHNVYVTKFYSTYYAFFVDIVENYKCYWVKDSFSSTKYGIYNESSHLYFNQPVTLTIYTLSADGSNCTKKYDNVTEESYICINPYDHGYSSTIVYNSDEYVDFFFQR